MAVVFVMIADCAILYKLLKLFALIRPIIKSSYMFITFIKPSMISTISFCDYKRSVLSVFDILIKLSSSGF